MRRWMLATGGCSSRIPTSLRRSRWRRATQCSQSRWLTPVSAVPFPILSSTRSLKAGSLRRHPLLRRRRRLGPALAPAARRVRRAVGGGGAALGAGAAADDRRTSRAARRLRAHCRCAPSAQVPLSMRRLTETLTSTRRLRSGVGVSAAAGGLQGGGARIRGQPQPVRLVALRMRRTAVNIARLLYQPLLN